MITLVAARDLKPGNWLVPEEYDASLQPSDYSEDDAVQISDVGPNAVSGRIEIWTDIEFAIVDPDAQCLIATQDREQAVPCRSCSTTTWNTDAICNHCK